jgi:hypothetical protein
MPYVRNPLSTGESALSGEPQEVRIARLRRLARLADAAIPIPGTRFAIGLDPLIGLLPGLRDALGAAVSGYIVLEAARLGAGASVLLRMLVNIGIDALVGAVPVAGDLFDFSWKANLKNVALLERHLADPRGARRASRGLLVVVATAMLVLFVALVVSTACLLRLLFRGSFS